MTTPSPARRRSLLLLLVALLLSAAGCAASDAVPAASSADGPVGGGGSASAADLRTGSGVAPGGAQLDLLAQLLASPKVPAAAAPAALAAEPPPSGPPYVTGPRPGSPVVVPPPALPPGDATVYAVGDSVLLGTEDYLRTTLGSGWDLRFDARVSRRFPEGIDVIHENRASVGQVAVVLLGHNYGGGRKAYGYLDQLMADLGKAQRVVFVTVAEWSAAQPEVNAAIRVLPFRYPNVVVADWQAVIAANPQFLTGDGVHLSRSGNIALANLVAVMIGPAPARDGRVPPPPRILPIPDEPDPAPGQPAESTTTLTWPGTSTTSSSTTTTTTPGQAATTTTVDGSTTTTSGPSTTGVSTTTSAPPPSTDLPGP